MRRGNQSAATVDTNIFISGLILSRGHPYDLIQALYSNDFVLVISAVLQGELTRVLARPRITSKYRVSPAAIEDLITYIALNAVYVTPLDPIPVEVRDPKDYWVVGTALAGNADYLVTGDNDLLALRGYPGLGDLKIVIVTEFLVAIGSR